MDVQLVSRQLWQEAMTLQPGWWVALGVYEVCFLVQIWFVLFRFGGVAFGRRFKAGLVGEPTGPLPPVSIVIACRNQPQQIATLLDALRHQTHPDHEVILVDDRSDDDLYDYLLARSKEADARFKLVRINYTPEHTNPKKYAITLGIKAARHNCILLTDADCLPTSPAWATHMAEAFVQPDTQVVLGYSPYARQPGILNALIRYDTFFTALQYFSFALAGRPYMGVGRNLAYRRSYFFANGGFGPHLGVMGGDDDLFINRTAKPNVVALVPHSAAHVVSEPKESLAAWARQKLRHLSVGRHYRLGDKLALGALVSSQVGFYLLGVALVWVWPLTIMALITFCIRLTLHWVWVRAAARRLGESFKWWQLPLLDAWMPAHYLIFGIPALFTKKIEWN